MQKTIVSDTSCLILLDKPELLTLLKSLFGRVTITKMVAEEFGKKLPEYISIENPDDSRYQQILETIVDKGEASAIAMALEKDDCLLILDDFKARKEAKHLKIKYTGTLGIIVLAKEKGFIRSVSEVIENIKKTNFRISEKYLDEIIKKSGE